MKLQILSVAESATLRLTGDLDLYHVEAAREALLRHLTDQSGLALELDGIQACDTAGLQLLVAARRSAVTAGRPFSIISSAPAIAICGESLGLPPEHWQAPAP